MEILYLTEADVQRLLTMDMALEAVESAFLRQSLGQLTNKPRQRLHAPGAAMLHYMAALDETTGYMGMKVYTSTKTGFRFLIPLYRSDSGHLVALIEADHLGCVRTGAASGIATKHMARSDAACAAIIGSGHQAPAQLAAIARVRHLSQVRVYSRTAEHREAFARRMSAELSLPVEAVPTGEAAVREADIVAVITTAKTPAVEGAWLAPGTHVNAAGVNHARRQEVDEETVNRARRIVVDSIEQSKEEAGDLIVPFQDQPQRWDTVRTLADVVGGSYPGREAADEITLFKSNGVALEDLATAVRVYERALSEGVGQRRSMWA